MNTSNSTQKFNDYLNDSLSEKQKLAFEEKLKKDKELSDSFRKTQTDFGRNDKCQTCLFSTL